MNDIIVVAIVLLAIGGGLVVGFLARGVIAAQSVKAAQDKAGRIVAEARAQQKELILQAKDEQVRLQRELEVAARGEDQRGVCRQQPAGQLGRALSRLPCSQQRAVHVGHERAPAGGEERHLPMRRAPRHPGTRGARVQALDGDACITCSRAATYLSTWACHE